MIRYWLTFLLLVCASDAFCQDAQISGLILDPSKSTLSGAEITVRNELTGGRRVTESNETGSYSVPSLSPGIYRLTIHASGFETIIREDVKLEIGDNARLDFTLRIGDSRTVVEVKGGPLLMNTEDASVGTVIDRNIIEQMPLNGRGIQGLIELTPGVVVVPAIAGSPGQLAVNGQRSDANYFTVDGVSANFAVGIPVRTEGDSVNTNGQIGSANLPANNILGMFSNLVSPDALQEFRIQTSTFAPEFGRLPGAQIGLATRSGSNRYSGSLFEYLRNDATDANDWFNNAQGLPKAPLRFNDFGGTLGGPLQIPGLYHARDRTFFFFSFEDLPLSQPMPLVTVVVPTSETRLAAPATLAPLLDALPLPNRPASVLGLTDPAWGVFVGNTSLRREQRSYGLRLDHYFNDKLTLFGRYNQSPSESSQGIFANPANLEQYSIQTQTLTLGLTHAAKPNLVNEVRWNVSRQSVKVNADLTGYGGATPPPDSFLFPTGRSNADTSVVINDGASSTGDLSLSAGPQAKTSARQLQFVDQLSYTQGAHALKFGVDYQWFSPVDSPPDLYEYLSFTSIYNPGEGYNGVTSVAGITRPHGNTAFSIPDFSAYAQDTWSVTRRVVVTYGLRWELNPAPHVSSGQFLAFDELQSLENLSNLSPLSQRAPLYRTQYSNVAPRVGLAWQLYNGQTNKTVLRAGGGLFYGLAQSGFEQSYAETQSYSSSVNVPFGSFISGGWPYLQTDGSEVAVVAGPQYMAPRVYEWNVTLEQSLGQEILSAAFVGSLSRHVIGSTYYPDSPLVPFLQISGSQFSSSYNSLQLQLNRRLSHHVQTLVSYTWSHSIDNLPSNLNETGFDAFLQPNTNLGPSDFDIRQSLNGAVLLNFPSPHHGIPKVLFGNWSASGIFFARSAAPTDLYAVSSSGLEIRPDYVPGQPLYLYGSGYPGGVRFNPAAFSIPPMGVEEGTLGRNVLRGFGAWQIDLALHRQFSLSEGVSLQFRVEAFNFLNHPNFANPANTPIFPGLEVVQPGWTGFGYSSAMLAGSLGPQEALGQLSPLFQIGGPRSLQFGLRLSF